MNDSSDFRGQASSALHSFSRLSSSLSEAIETGPAQLVALYRREVRVAADALTLALLTAYFASVAAMFTALSVLIALWRSHAVLVSALLGAFFAVLAVSAIVLLRARTRGHSS